MSDFEVMLEMLSRTPNFDKAGKVLWDVVCFGSVNIIHVAAGESDEFSALAFDKEGYFLGINFEAPEVA